MVEKNFKTAAIGMMTSLIMPFFLKNYAKNGSNVFFSKPCDSQKKDFQDLSSSFESQDNIQIEYILVNILFLKSPLKRC